MTSREFSGVDPDLLADYVGGALDGTPEQATVARLIESDPAWGDAYVALARAVDLVRADLADWAAAPAPELPLAVAERITAALAGAGPAPTAAAGSDAEEPAGVPAPGGLEIVGSDPDSSRPAEVRAARTSPPAVVPAQPRRADGVTRPAERPARNTGPGRRSRRWARIAGPVALAAASVTAVGFGISHLVGANRGVTSMADNAGPAAGRAQPELAQGAGAPFRTAAPPQHSGTDYSPDQLPGSIMTLASPSAVHGPGLAPDDRRQSDAAGLERLTRPEALESCLGAISAEHRAGLITLDLVDYASFQGRPALVVTFVDGSGERWAWVSGAECGVPGSGADTRFRTRVG
ncbi:hypothetical protein [Micromonospora sp. CB01531]|uniref:hypothetical protein n=1 Tax=Micromonospora sp. CB01531 TaxID=1718947 RepID=UPI0009389E58|nr:hypothetical protein [Micromonospora sp. CB01531]OKI57894.1 hypothetical protein A6A27_06480 [Micromonospora sp. CB01531]